MSKYTTLYNALKGRNLTALYYDERIMFYNEGWGEIQFWELKEVSEDVLCLSNKGIEVFFDNWELTGAGLLVSLKGYEAARFKFPSKSKIAANHNHFYVDQFATNMSYKLDDNVPNKGDWADCNYQQVVGLLKKNVGNLDNNTNIKESCIDIANFAMMAYYLGGKNESENNKTPVA